MKKLFALTVSLVMLFTLSACSGRTPSPATGTDAVGSSEPSVSLSDDITVRVTFPEGYTLIQIAQRLEENGVCSADDFMALATDYDYLCSLEYRVLEGVKSAENVAYYLEGYIFPDTYDFYKGESAEKALSRFLRNAESKITDEYIARAYELGYSIHEIIALASIIQEEAGDPAEMYKVSSVFHNRLDNPSGPTVGMLQSDVTIFYVNDNITDSPYLEGDTSAFAPVYNTYKCKGLPAGPICNPGIEAIRAALYPAETDYFFFFTDKEGQYYYNHDFNVHKNLYNELVKNK